MQLFVETVKKLHGLVVIKHDLTFEELETSNATFRVHSTEVLL